MRFRERKRDCRRPGLRVTREDAQSAGLTNNSKQTNALTGLPGSPNTSVRPLCRTTAACPASCVPGGSGPRRRVLPASRARGRTCQPRRRQRSTQRFASDVADSIIRRDGCPASRRAMPRLRGAPPLRSACAVSIGPLVLRICPGSNGQPASTSSSPLPRHSRTARGTVFAFVRPTLASTRTPRD